MSYKSLLVSNCRKEAKKRNDELLYLSKLLNLQLPLGTIAVLLDCAEEKIDLSDNNLGQGRDTCRTASTGASRSTEGSRVGMGVGMCVRMMRRMIDAGLKSLRRIWRK